MSLLSFTSQLDYSPTTVDNPPVVRGFASTSVRDRSGDIVPAKEFDLTQFMATSGQLLLDHNFIATPEGNKVSAGNVKMAIAAYISEENFTNSDEWIVKAIDTNEFVSTWPKSLSPNMTVGTDGVFVVAEVTNPLAASLVNEGKVSSFSWRGYSQEQVCEDGTCVLKAIDLVEISLVHLPDNPTSTFLLTDKNDPNVNFEVIMKDCDVYGVKFSKDQYSIETIKEYTKKLNINTFQISDNTDSYFLNFGESLVDTAKSFEFSHGDKTIIAAPKIKKLIIESLIVRDLTNNVIEENNMDNNPEIQAVEKTESPDPVKLLLVDFDALQNVKGISNITLQKSAVLEDMPVEIHTATFEVLEEVVEEVEAVVEEVVTEAVAEVVEEVSAEEVVEEVVAEEVAETQPAEDNLSKILDAVIGLNAKIDANEAKLAKLESSIEEKNEEVVETLKQYQKNDDAKVQQAKLDKVLSAFGGATPTETPQVEVEKSIPTVAVSGDVVDPLSLIFVNSK